ncbi:MAG: hypothetical protein ACE5ID_02850 [Acidobacteriota bacterium]
MASEALAWVLVDTGVAVFGLAELVLLFFLVRARRGRPSRRRLGWAEEGTWMAVPLALLVVLLLLVQGQGIIR